MKCIDCGSETTERLASGDAPYAYVLSGLKDVYLTGIKVVVCAKCKSESPVMTRLPELHKVMAEVLASKNALLSGEEIRFLRKSAGFKAGTFAEHIGISPEHLSRVENGKTDKLGEAADKLARVICLAQIDAQSSDAIRVLLLKRAVHLKAMRTRRLKRHFGLARGVWTAAE